MKTSAFIATLLTFLMVLLVLAAAVLFLWQGRQRLEEQVTGLETGVASAASTATAVRAYADAREAAAGTSEALLATSEAALATSQAEYDTSIMTSEAVSHSRATLAAQSATQEAVLAPLAAPYVSFAYPNDGTVFTTNSRVQLVIAVGHPYGIDRLALYGLGDTVLLPGGSDPYRVYNHQLDPPLSQGSYTVTATITSRNQLSASDTLSFSVVPSATDSVQEETEGNLWEQVLLDPIAAYWPRQR
ncbi:MAG: hypothetical protein RRC07_05730 [Anaerolineae bacterium]|nr:hypothetical protein [Anaerolineae bacterium]